MHSTLVGGVTATPSGIGKRAVALFPLFFDQYKLWNPFTSAKLSNKSISGVYIYIEHLKNPKKAAIKESGCHCKRFFVTVTAYLLVLEGFC